MLLVFVVVLIDHHNFSGLRIRITIANNDKKVNRSIVKQNAILAPFFSHGTFFSITSRASTTLWERERGSTAGGKKVTHLHSISDRFLAEPVLLIGVADSGWCRLSLPLLHKRPRPQGLNSRARMGNTKSFLEQQQDQSKAPRRPFAPLHNSNKVSCITSKLLLHQHPLAVGHFKKATAAPSPSSSRPLQNLLLARDWQRVLCRVQLYPDELRHYFRFQISADHVVQILPLHLACALQPPLAVVQVMLGQYIDASAMPIIPPKKKKKKQPKQRRIPRSRRHRFKSAAARHDGPMIVHEPNEDEEEETPSFFFTARASSNKSSTGSTPTTTTMTHQGEGSLAAIAADNDDPHADDASSNCSSISSHGNNNNHKGVILQLSPNGTIHPMSIVHATEMADTGSETMMFTTMTNRSGGRGTASSPFRVHWDMDPLFQHVMDETGTLLPLHIACLYSAGCADVVQALVQAYPAAALGDVMGMLPIHWLAAGWNVSSLSPISSPTTTTTTTGSSNSNSPLDALIALKRTVPDSVRIRSGSHGMTPSEYLTECMVDGPTKQSCLLAVAEVDEGDDDQTDKESSVDQHSLIFGPSDDEDDEGDDDDNTTGIGRVARRRGEGENETDSLLPPSISTTTTTTTTTCMGRLFEDRDWEALLAAVELDPPLAQQWIYGLDPDEPCVWKRLPLHLACAYGAPLGLIMVLLRAYPAGVDAVDPRDGRTALHLCCCHHHSAAMPIVRVLLERRQHAVHVVDRLGRLPLHVAVLADAPYGIIEALVEEYPGTVLTRDARGQSAVDYATRLYNEKKKDHCCVYELLVGLSTMLNEFVVPSEE